MVHEVVRGEPSRPVTILDVGCGDGAWVRALERIRACEITGIDGPWCPFERAIRFNFNTADIPFRPDLPRTSFDAVLCLEFAEHLSPERARPLCAFLASLSDTVIFSAATPGQGGTGHLNEQWPAYWVSIFADLGFVACDLFRPRIWKMTDVAPWYRQNMVAFFKGAVPEHVSAACLEAWGRAASDPLSLAPPEIYRRGPAWTAWERIRAAYWRVGL